MEFTLEVGERTVEKIVDGIPFRRHMRRNEKIVVAPHIMRRARLHALAAILAHYDTVRRLPEKPLSREFQLKLI